MLWAYLYSRAAIERRQPSHLASNNYTHLRGTLVKKILEEASERLLRLYRSTSRAGTNILAVPVA